jgi:hypothetical protein
MAVANSCHRGWRTQFRMLIGAKALDLHLVFPIRKMASHIIGFILLMFSCTGKDTTIDKSKLLGVDYRLFQDTLPGI